MELYLYINIEILKGIFMNEFANEIEEAESYGNIKTLTILTFIGSSLGLIFGVLAYAKSAENLAKMQDLINGPDFDKLPDYLKKMYSQNTIDFMNKMDVNKLPILILNFIGCGLCIYGAIEMRKLKMSGFYTYLMGSLLPFIGMFLFMGTSYLKGGYNVYISLGVTALFITLYGFQTKYLDGD